MSSSLRALLYLRVSTDRQAEKGIALPTQEECCRRYALAHGYDLDDKTDLYIDRGESARSMARPALLDLLTRCKEDGSVRAVVVYDVSRLARNRLDFAFIKQSLRKAGVTLLSATEPINDTPEGQMLEGVLSTVAEFFSAQNGRKVQANMRRKAESGTWPTRAPYGYINRKERLPGGAVRAWIEPHPTEAQWVRRAFDLFASGSYSVKALARHLDREGFVVRQTAHRRSTMLHHSQLERLLSDRFYIGTIDWGGIVNENGTHERLILPEQFHRVQELLRSRSLSVSRAYRHRTAFARITRCDECKCWMTIDVQQVSRTKSVRYLRCRKISGGQPVQCGQRYHAESAYATAAVALLRRLELSPQQVTELRDLLARLDAGDRETYEHAKEKLENEKLTIEQRQEKLLLTSLDAILQDDNERSIYDRVRLALAEQRVRVSGELARLKRRLEALGRILTMTLQVASCVGRAVDECPDPDAMGRLLRVCFSELRCRDGRIVGGTLTAPIVALRRWCTEKPLARLLDFDLYSAHNSTSVEGCTSCLNDRLPLLFFDNDLSSAHNSTSVEGCGTSLKRHESPSVSEDELLRLMASIDQNLEDDLTACYHELRGRGIITLLPEK